MTAFGDLSSAIHPMDLDVFEYLTKPFDLTDGLKSIAKAILANTNQAANHELADPIQAVKYPVAILASSGVIARVMLTRPIYARVVLFGVAPR